MKKTLFLVLTLSLAFCANAQNKMLRSNQLMNRELYPSRPMQNLQFVPGTNLVAYSQDTVLYTAPFANGKLGKAKPLFKTSDISKALVAVGERSIDNMTYVEFINAKEVKFSLFQRVWVYNIQKKTITPIREKYNHNQSNVNPYYDEASRTYRLAYSRNEDTLIIQGKKGDVVLAGSPDIVYGKSVHRNEFGIDGGIFWSPKGNRVAFYRMDQSMVADYPMVKTSNKGIAQVQPFKYPMAGEKSHEVTVGVCNVETNEVLYLETRKNNSIEERENYLTNITWSPDEKFVYIAKVNRAQNHMWLERYNAINGKLDKVLFEETNPRYVEPCEGLYFLPNNPEQFLWLSLRDGYKHIYLYNTSGDMIRQITTGEYEIEGIIGFDAKAENLFVYANKDNYIGRAAYRINLASGNMVAITDSKGTHSVIVNKEGTACIDLWSAVDVPACATIRDFASNSTTTLYTASNPLAEYAMPGVTTGSIKAADGVTDLYYRLITPPNMEPGKKYPTLVYVYGGPHSQLVTDNWLAGGNLYFTFLAQQGYVVYTLDSRGTDNRGFEFESCTHRQLGTIEVADQMEGVKFLQSLPYVDSERMGVEGWSFGGFMTITMKLKYPQIFKVACAGGPVIDWKWYEIMYGERYMDTPQENPEGYRDNSLLLRAKDLEGRLLVIHGAEDNTVVWQHSIEFVQACIKAGKKIDYFFYPHHEHNVIGYDRNHLFEKMFDYYETHLK